MNQLREAKSNQFKPNAAADEPKAETKQVAARPTNQTVAKKKKASKPKYSIIVTKSTPGNNRNESAYLSNKWTAKTTTISIKSATNRSLRGASS